MSGPAADAGTGPAAHLLGPRHTSVSSSAPERHQDPADAASCPSAATSPLRSTPIPVPGQSAAGATSPLARHVMLNSPCPPDGCSPHRPDSIEASPVSGMASGRGGGLSSDADGSAVVSCRLGKVISPPPVYLPQDISQDPFGLQPSPSKGSSWRCGIWRGGVSPGSTMVVGPSSQTPLCRGSSHDQHQQVWFGGTIKLGLCCMAKKQRSKQMAEFKHRLEATGLFEVVHFEEDVILDHPVADWPRVDCCIPFFSAGFPLDKACQYAALHPDCFCLTEPSEQKVLLDRRAVYHALVRNNIPTSRHIVCSRDGWMGAPEPELIEHAEYIIVNGERMDKPFVEKPVDSEDHNIRIYYADGKGSRHLFRKVGDRSSEFHADVNSVRREGSYIYEEFINAADAQDVKVYTVGTDYFHAECRKSPVVDGAVTRDESGKEVRSTTPLSEQEQQIARKIVKVFRQRVCGFDLLRSTPTQDGRGKSFVCDVNGWSFVKGNSTYYDRASAIIADIFVEEMRRRGLARIYRDPRQCGARQLKGVIALFRHGDRTPKQKIKLKTAHPALLKCAFGEDMGASAGTGGPGEIVVKGDGEGLKRLRVWRDVLETVAAADGCDPEDAGKLRGMCEIISREAEGLKLQCKPQKIDKETAQVKSVQLIMKWGGWLTEAGRKQARHLGDNFTKRIFRGNEFVEHMRIFANNERRVKATASEFALALKRAGGCSWSDTQINPGDRGDRICRALDDTEPAKAHIERCKEFVREVMHADSEEECERWQHLPGFREIMQLKPTPRRAMYSLWQLSNELIEHIPEGRAMHRGESCALLKQRWTTLARAFYDDKKGTFDTTKISDIFDYITYDVSYNQKALSPLDMYPLFELAHAMHSFVVIAEYGLFQENRATIGSLIAAPLLREWREDIDELQLSDTPQTRLYFSSESHVQALYNCLFNCSAQIGQPFHVVSDPIPLHYLAHIVMKVYKYNDMPDGALGRYQYEVFYSGGIDTNAFGIVQDHHVTKLSPMIRIHNNLFYRDFCSIVAEAETLAADPLPSEDMIFPAERFSPASATFSGLPRFGVNPSFLTDVASGLLGSDSAAALAPGEAAAAAAAARVASAAQAARAATALHEAECAAMQQQDLDT